MSKKLFIILISSFIFMLPVNASITEEEQLTSISQNLSAIKKEQSKRNLLDELYPVGSIYITTSSENPSSTLGGKWEAFAQGRTLVGVDENNYNESMLIGGNENQKLSVSNLPPHTHNLQIKGSVSSSYSGKNASTSSVSSHTHNMYFHGASNETGNQHALVDNSVYQYFSDRIIVNGNSSDTTSLNGAHSHSITPKGNVSSTFKGNNNQTEKTGSDASFSIMNPYITVYIWRRES